tara:strand:+ start:489 stop:1925 length:1437 start_codon:yes stop_codon:yes gene_type:complete
MSFSQQSYTGQGITQQNVVDQSGQNLARGIESFGKGLSRGIEGRAKIKSQAASLRSKLAPHADSLAEKYNVDPGNWKAFLDDQGLGQLQGISEGYIVSMAKELHDAKVAESRMKVNQVEQGNAAISGFMQANMPGSVPTQRTDYSGEIDQARSEVGRLEEGIKNFAPTIEAKDVRMEVPPPIYDLPKEAQNFQPTLADRFAGDPLSRSAKANQQKDARMQQQIGQVGQFMQNQARPNREDEAQVMEQRQAYQDQLKGLEDAKNQLQLLEAKQQAELDKPDTRPQTAEEFAKSRAKNINKLIEDNPLAASTIYSLLMGPKVDAPKLDSEARKAIGFANRMESADAELAKISDKYDRSGSSQGILSIIPGQLKSQERRQYEAVMTDWITANLRRESGAAIGKEEYKNDMIKYFPSAGDSDETMKLKAQLRKNAIQAITKPIEDSFNTGRGASFPSFSSPQQSGQSGLVKVYGSDGNLISR